MCNFILKNRHSCYSLIAVLSHGLVCLPYNTFHIPFALSQHLGWLGFLNWWDNANLHSGKISVLSSPASVGSFLPCAKFSSWIWLLC